MVLELMDMVTEIDTDKGSDFVEDLYKHLDPYLPFREQQSEEQEKYLNYLYEKFVNGDEEAAQEAWDK